MEMKKCLHCHTEFRKKRGFVTYCSIKCRDQHREKKKSPQIMDEKLYNMMIDMFKGDCKDGDSSNDNRSD